MEAWGVLRKREGCKQIQGRGGSACILYSEMKEKRATIESEAALAFICISSLIN